MQSSFVIIGTAGHIDHGKTTLVKALTGLDTDRLKEEKERGITIELGFAALELDGGKKIGVVDVPGHERFIRNMLAGAVGIDIIMMIIDVNEGVMPQTREHLAILQLLDLQHGVIVLTKTDIADPEWIELVTQDIRDEVKGTFLEHAAIVPVSSITGVGIAELRNELQRLVEQVQPRPTTGTVKMPIDRVFTVAGFGTVVTGTLWRGTVRVGDTLSIYPNDVQARVRSIEVHGERTDVAYAGQRVALNLTGVDREVLERGSTLASAGSLHETDLVDARLALLPDAPRPIRSGTRVRLHIGTSEVMGRVILLDRNELENGEDTLVQIRLESPIACEAQERYVVRSYSPIFTIGGGSIIDPHPSRLHRRNRDHILDAIERKEKMDEAGLVEQWLIEQPFLTEMELVKQGMQTHTFDTEQTIKDALDTGLTRGSIIAIQPIQQVEGAITETAPQTYASNRWWNERLQDIDHISSEYYKQKRLDIWIPRTHLFQHWKGMKSKQAEQILLYAEQNGQIERNGDMYRLAGYAPKLTQNEQQVKQGILNALSVHLLQPPNQEELEQSWKGKERVVRDMLGHLKHMGEIVEIEAHMWLTSRALEQAIQIVQDICHKQADFRVAEFRDSAATSRKYAVAILEYLDRQKVTKRDGDLRKLSK